MANIEVLANEFLIQINTTTGTTTGNTIARTESFTLNANGAPVDITTFDSNGWKAFLMGVKDWTVDASGVVTRSGATSISGMTAYDLLWSSYKNSSPLQIVIKATIAGDKYETGVGFISKLSASYKTNEKATYSIAFQGTGALTTVQF